MVILKRTDLNSAMLVAEKMLVQGFHYPFPAVAFVEKSGVPFLPMSMAKGLLPDTHAQSASAARSFVLAEADVVMLVGARLNWLLSHGKGKTWGAANGPKKFIQIDIEPKEMDSNVEIVAPVVGDIASCVTALLENLENAETTRFRLIIGAFVLMFSATNIFVQAQAAFNEKKEADAYVQELRMRGHRAHAVAGDRLEVGHPAEEDALAHVPDGSCNHGRGRELRPTVGGREDDPLGLGTDVGEGRGGVGRDERRVVVLAGRKDVEPDLLGLLRDRDGGLDPLVLGRRPAGRRVGGDVERGEAAGLADAVHVARGAAQCHQRDGEQRSHGANRRAHRAGAPGTRVAVHTTLLVVHVDTCGDG